MEGAFGDTLLTVASIMDLAKTVQELGTNNTIYFSILDRSNKTFFPLIASLFPPSEFPNVRVIKSAEYDALGQIQETLKTDAYNQQHATPQGIVLSFNGIHSTKIEQNELPSSVRLATFDLPGLKGFLHPPDHPEQATFRRIRQLELSQIFGTTMFNPYDRDDIQPIQDALHQQAQEYLATDPALQETIRELENDPNSTGGFIVILPTGQTEAKQILPDIYGQFNEQFAEYCRTNKIGIIHLTTDVLHQQNTQLLKQKEQPGISYTYMTIQENDDFRKLLAILSMPKIIAGFGSDTGPSHFMALERDFPIAMLFADADPGVFTAKPGILSIEHWVAKKASRGGGVLLPHLTQEFITWIHHHPLTISEEEIAQMHPLVAEWQKEYVKELKSQLGEFLQRVQDSHE